MLRSSRPMSNDDRALLAAAAACAQAPTLELLTPEVARSVAAARGIDFATALIHDRVRRGQNLDSALELAHAAEPDSWAALGKRGVKLAIVPGAFYRSHPHTGAHGRQIQSLAERHGVASEIVPIESFGSLGTNAEILCDWLARSRHRKVILVSLSKGGADVRRAFELGVSGAFDHVEAWVNFSGVTEGVALVDWLLARPIRSWGVRLLFRYHGYDFDVLDELRPSASSPRAWSLPPGMQAIHVVGFPLRRHLSSRLARRGHRRIAPSGPNDGGGILLAEAVHRPGIIYPVWGADHYFQSPECNVTNIVQNVLNLLHARERSVELPAPGSIR